LGGACSPSWICWTLPRDYFAIYFRPPTKVYFLSAHVIPDPRFPPLYFMSSARSPPRERCNVDESGLSFFVLFLSIPWIPGFGERSDCPEITFSLPPHEFKTVFDPLLPFNSLYDLFSLFSFVFGFCFPSEPSFIPIGFSFSARCMVVPTFPPLGYAQFTFYFFLCPAGDVLHSTSLSVLCRCSLLRPLIPLVFKRFSSPQILTLIRAPTLIFFSFFLPSFPAPGPH